MLKNKIKKSKILMSHYHNTHYIKGTLLQTKQPLTSIYIILDSDDVNLMVSGQFTSY